MDTPVPMTSEVDEYQRLVSEAPDIATKRRIALAGLAAFRAQLRADGVTPFTIEEILELRNEGRKTIS